MSTIGGKDIIPKGFGTVSLSQNYDYIHAHKGIEYCNLLYKLSATALTESMKDDEGTWILTKIKH